MDSSFLIFQKNQTDRATKFDENRSTDGIRFASEKLGEVLKPKIISALITTWFFLNQ